MVHHDEGLEFNGSFDAAQAQGNVPGVFTLSHEGELGLDVPRTRDFYKHYFARIGSQKTMEWTLVWQHCVLIDNATGWPQVALITAAELCGAHPRCELEKCESHQAALDRVFELKSLLYERENMAL